MATNIEVRYIVVKDPKSKLLPRFVRVYLGERYMFLNVYPLWTKDLQAAHRFDWRAAAEAYIYKADGSRRSGMETAVVWEISRSP